MKARFILALPRKSVSQYWKKPLALNVEGILRLAIHQSVSILEIRYTG